MTKKKDNLSKGDKVAWKSYGQDVTGKVTGKHTDRTRAAGRTVDASEGGTAVRGRERQVRPVRRAQARRPAEEARRLLIR